MKRILAMAVLLAMPTWAGQKLPTTQTKEPPLEGRHRLSHGSRVGFGCAF